MTTFKLHKNARPVHWENQKDAEMQDAGNCNRANKMQVLHFLRKSIDGTAIHLHQDSDHKVDLDNIYFSFTKKITLVDIDNLVDLDNVFFSFVQKKGKKGDKSLKTKSVSSHVRKQTAVIAMKSYLRSFFEAVSRSRDGWRKERSMPSRICFLEFESLLNIVVDHNI